MVNVTIKICIEELCDTISSFNLPDKTIGL